MIRRSKYNFKQNDYGSVMIKSKRLKVKMDSMWNCLYTLISQK